MTNLNEIQKILPKELMAEVLNSKEKLSEIRLRVGREAVLHYIFGYKVTNCRITQTHLSDALHILSKCSVYAYSEEIKRGFITASGGHRIGICGRCVTSGGKITNITDICGLNIRIAREVLDCSKDFCDILRASDNPSALIISPPAFGKTTFIRDIARNLGKTRKVCIIDEKEEIAGGQMFDLGLMTDVLSLCPKGEGIERALMNMGPEIIITDELSFPDTVYIKKIFNCGASIIATAHGGSLEETVIRLGFSDIIKYFGFIVLLGDSPKKGSIKKLATGREVYGSLCSVN